MMAYSILGFSERSGSYHKPTEYHHSSSMVDIQILIVDAASIIQAGCVGGNSIKILLREKKAYTVHVLIDSS